LTSLNVSEYAASLSGNDMEPITLDYTEKYGVVGTEGYGVLLTVNPNDIDVYNRLVGRCDYIIKIYSKSDPK